MGDTSALDAIVGDLQEELGDEPPSDPSAVNMEVATEGSVTARKEDGSRVSTPGASTGSKRPGPPPPPVVQHLHPLGPFRMRPPSKRHLRTGISNSAWMGKLCPTKRQSTALSIPQMPTPGNL
uniref:Uncharacterized protein n=1 Tax=Bionectria ochroleuca TaxID=29856 RepID=A0A8H7NNG8_BIOOC